MKLIEHLECVLGLVERTASHSEIKGALIAMHEEVAGAQRAAESHLKLLEENAALRAENEKLKPKTPPEIRLHTGSKFPGMGMT